MKLDPYLTPQTKFTKMDQRLEAETITLLDENIGLSLHDLGLGKFLKYET